MGIGNTLRLASFSLLTIQSLIDANPTLLDDEVRLESRPRAHSVEICVRVGAGSPELFLVRNDRTIVPVEYSANVNK